MKFIIASLALVLSVSAFATNNNNNLPVCKDRDGNVVSGSLSQLQSIMNNPKNNRPQVLVAGTITEIHKEDNSGLPHQKFSLQVNNNITLEIVSNLDFGRIPLTVGKTITICGEYLKVGNGMVHWTHFAPHGGHADGFSILDGQLYGDKEL